MFSFPKAVLLPQAVLQALLLLKLDIYQYFEGLINPINNMNFKPRRSGLS